MIGSIFAFTAIMLLAFFLHGSLKVKPALTPLLSIVTIIDFIMVFAMFGALKYGTALAFVLSIVAAGYTCRSDKSALKNKILSFLTPGVVFFLVSRAGMLWILSVTQPVFHGWDEFSFWGTAQKILYKYDALYTYHNTSMLGQSIPPAMPVLSYFFNFFSAGLTEWVSYFGYDVLFFACFAAMTATFEKKDTHTAFAVYAAGFMLPFVFEITEMGTKLASTYISAYGDIPMALVFAAAVAVYFYSEDSVHSLMCTLPALMFLTLIKDMGFALSCIVVFIAFFDMLVGRSEYVLLRLKGFFAKCAAAFAMLSVTAGSYIGWSIHISKVLKIDRNDFSESTSIGMAEMLITGVSELLGEKSRRFEKIFESMVTAFFETRVSMLGRGVKIVLIITVIFALAFIFGDKTGKKRSAMMYITTWTGFIGYYIFHLFLYVYLFKNDGLDLASYDRYMYIFYIGWLCMAIMCLATAVQGRWSLPAKSGLFALFAGLLFVVNIYTDTENTFLSVTRDSFPNRGTVQKKAEYLADVIGKDDVIYIASEDNGGENWFIYTYELLDNKIVQDHFIWYEADGKDERDRIAHKVMAEYFKKNGVTHLLVDNANKEFLRRYSRNLDTNVKSDSRNKVFYFKINFIEDSFYGTLVKGGKINE